MSDVATLAGAAILLAGGLLGLLASMNAARPIIDPTRRYSPWWLPAMVVIELAPFWLTVHAGVLGAGLLLGGWSNSGGRIGAVAIAMSMVLLVWLAIRSAVGVVRLGRLLDGVIHPARGWARLVGRPIPTPPGVRERHRIEWSDGLTLDLVRPDDDRDRLPTLVYVHGGGWTGGDPQRQARDLYHTLALDGWAVVAIRYPFTPAVTVEQQIETVRAAVAWVRSDLAGHGVAPTRIAIAGGSAGGHLAAMIALTSPEHAPVAACVGMYGVYDMANRNRTRAHWQKTVDEVMLATVAEAPDRYRAVSPIDQPLDDSPPVLLVHGTHDTLVPIAEGRQFAEVLRTAGRPVELVPVYGAQHAFDAVSSVTSRTTAAVVRDWLRRTALAESESADGQAPTAW